MSKGKACFDYAMARTDGAARAETELALAMPSRDRGRRKSKGKMKSNGKKVLSK